MQIEGEYGVTVINGRPDRPDDPAKWHPAKLSEKETRARYGGASLEDLLAWQDNGFPKPHMKQRTVIGTFATRTIREWDIDGLDAFDARIREIAARLPKR